MRRRLASVFLLALGFFLLSHGGHFYAADNYTVYLTGRAFVEGPQLDIPKRFGTVEGSDGKFYAQYSPGLPLLQAPLAELGALLDWAFPQLFNRTVGAPVSIFYPENASVFAASLVSPIFGALCAAAFWGVAERLGYRLRIVGRLTIILILATQIWPAARDSFPQIVVAFCLLGALFDLLAWRDRRLRTRPLLTGSLLGLLVLVRPFDGALTLPPLLTYAVVTGWTARGRTQLVRDACLLCLPVVLCGLIVVAHNLARFGDPLTLVPMDQIHQAFNHPIPTGLYGLLLSAQHGLIFYSPPVIGAVVGLYLLGKRRPAEALLLSSTIGIYLLAYARYSGWDAGESWGTRYLVPIVPLAMLSLGELLKRGGPLRACVLSLTLAGLLVQIAGTQVDFHRVLAEVARDREAGTFLERLTPIWRHWMHLAHRNHLDALAWRLHANGSWFALVAHLLLAYALLSYGVGGIVTAANRRRRLPDLDPQLSADGSR